MLAFLWFSGRWARLLCRVQASLRLLGLGRRLELRSQRFLLSRAGVVAVGLAELLIAWGCTGEWEEPR